MQKRQEAEQAAATAVDHSGEETPEEEGVDEPTREFMPISRERVSVASRNIEPPVSLFSEEEEEEEGTVDMNEYMKNVQAMQQQMMQNMQQMMQGNGMQNYLQQVQVLQQQLASGQISAEEYTAKVQQLAAQNFGN